MINQILSTLEPAIVTAAVGVATAAITAVGTYAVKFIQKKVEALQVKIGADTYAANLAKAQAVWNIVDEDERVSGLKKTIAEKQTAFAAELKKMIPSLTDDEIAQLRQAVAGVVNQGKAIVTAKDTEAAKPTDQKAAETVTKVMDILNAAMTAVSALTQDNNAPKDTAEQAAADTAQAAPTVQ